MSYLVSEGNLSDGSICFPNIIHSINNAPQHFWIILSDFLLGVCMPCQISDIPFDILSRLALSKGLLGKSLLYRFSIFRLPLHSLVNQYFVCRILCLLCTFDRFTNQDFLAAFRKMSIKLIYSLIYIITIHLFLFKKQTIFGFCGCLLSGH